nr:hypothetical protein [Tanacetum cinerariifolium]
MSSVIAQQTKLDIELILKEKRLDIGKCNGRLNPRKIQKDPKFQVVLDALALTPCYFAFLITADVSEICPRVQGQDFDAHLANEEIVSFLRDLGHNGEINSLNDARKFKKPASLKLTTILVSTEEPTGKSKRVKRPTKKSTKASTRGVVIRETPEMPLSKKKKKITVEKHKEIDMLSEVSVLTSNKDEDPFTGSGRWLKKMKTSKDTEPAKGPKAKESQSGLSKGDKSQSKSSGKSVQSEEPEFEVTNADMVQDQEENLGAVTLTLFELKKILIDKMDKSKSYLAAPEHRECYEGLRKSYDLDKTIFFTYGKVYSLKRSRKDKDEDPSTRSKRGLKKRKTSKDAEPTKGPRAKESQSGSSKGDKYQAKSFGKSVQSEEPEFKIADAYMPQEQAEKPSNDDEEPKEKQYTKSFVALPVKIEAHKELPKVSLVNESLKKLKLHVVNFDNVVTIRTTPNARTEGEWEFEHTKSSVDKQRLEIAKIELLLEIDRILQQIMSQDILLTVMNPMSLIGEYVNMERKQNESCDKCFNPDAELLKSQNAHNDLLK